MSKPQPPPTPLAKTAAGSENVVGSLVYINNHKQTTSQLNHSIIGQQFDILGVLGTGCYGRTYKVVDKLRYFKQFALKRTKTHFQQSIKEATTLLELNNPCIIPVFSCWREQDSLFIETSLGDLNLQEILDNYGALPESLFWAIAQDISFALDECFNRQIAHLDVKPSNVLVVHKRYFGDFVNNLDFSGQNCVRKSLFKFNTSTISYDRDNFTPNIITYENLRTSGFPDQFGNGLKQSLKGEAQSNEGHELILSDLSESIHEEQRRHNIFLETTPTRRKTPVDQGFVAIISPNAPEHRQESAQTSQLQDDQMTAKIPQQFTVTYEPPLQKLQCSTISDLEDRCIFQLIDFGQSQKAQNEQFNECNCGDSAYVDYQFMQTSRPSFYSDLFSFGLMLLEIITGIKLPVQGILFEKLRTQQWYECFPNDMFGTNLRDVIEYKSDELIDAQVQINVSVWRSIGDILSGKVQNIRQWRQKYWDILEHQKRQDIYQLVEKFNQMQFDVQQEQMESKCIVISRDLHKQLQLRKAHKSAGPKLLKSKKLNHKHKYSKISQKGSKVSQQISNQSNVGFVPLDNLSAESVHSRIFKSKNTSSVIDIDKENEEINSVIASKCTDNGNQDDINKSKITSQSLKRNKSQAILSQRRRELIFSQIQSLRDFIIKGGKYCKGNQQTFIKQDMMGSVTVLKTSDVLIDQQNAQHQQEIYVSYGPTSLVNGTELYFTNDGRNISPDWQNDQVMIRPNSSHELLMDGALSFNENELNQIFFQDAQAPRQKVNSFVHLSVLESGEDGQNENMLSMRTDTDQCLGLDAAGLCIHDSECSLMRQDSDFIQYNPINEFCSKSKNSPIASGVILSKQLDSENNFTSQHDKTNPIAQQEPKLFVLSNQSKQNKDVSSELNYLEQNNKSESLWRLSEEYQQKNSVIQMGTENIHTERSGIQDKNEIETPVNDDFRQKGGHSENSSKSISVCPKNVKLILPQSGPDGTSVFQQCKSSSNALLSGTKLDSQIDLLTGKPDPQALGMSRRSSSEISLQSHQGVPYTRFEEISTENRVVDEGNGQSANFILSEAVKAESDYSSGDYSIYSESVVPKTLQDAYIRSTRVFGSIFSAIETLTGVGTMVYFPTYRDLYRTPTLHNLSHKDKNGVSKNFSGQNLARSAQESTNIVTTDLQTAQCGSNANNLPPLSKKIASKHLQYHELSDMNQLNFQGRFRPLSGNYNVLRKAELELHGYYTPRGNTNSQATQGVFHVKSSYGIPRWVVFSCFNSAFMQYAYLLKFFTQLHFKNYNSFLFKTKGVVLFTLFVALIIVLHGLNRRNQVVLVDAVYRQIGTSGVYVNMEKFLSSIYGFFAPILLYFSNFCYFMYTNGEAKVNYFVFNLVQNTFIFAFEKLVDYNYAPTSQSKYLSTKQQQQHQKEHKSPQEKNDKTQVKKTKSDQKLTEHK